MPKSSKEDIKTFSNFNLNGVCAQLLSRFQLFVTLWTVPGQAPLSMGFFFFFFWRAEWILFSFIFKYKVLIMENLKHIQK